LKYSDKYFYKDFLKSELLRSTTVLISGTVFAQLISILLQPVIRRIFSPEDFGVYTVYLSIIGIILVLSSLKYDDAIVLPRSDKESINLVGLSIGISFILNLIVFILFLLLGRRIIAVLNLPNAFHVELLYIVPAGAFLFSIYQSLNAWLIRKKKYYAVSVNKLVRRGSEGVSQIGFSLFKTANGLIYSDIIGQFANVGTSVIQARKSGLNFRILSWHKIKYVFKKYSEFPRYNLIPSFMSTCSYLLPPVFINRFFSAESAGFFDLSKLLLSIPLAFIASSVSNVILQRISEKFNKKESFITEIKPVFLIVLMISVAEVLIIIFLGEPLFRIIFGNEWITSGVISKILVWSFAFNFVISSFTSVFIAMRKIKTYSVWQSLYFLAILSLLFFRSVQFSEFLKIYVLIEIVSYLIAAIVIVSIILRYESSLKLE